MASILIVEDELLVSKMYKKLLELQGNTVTVVSDGKQASDLLQTMVPDVILLDMMMPKMNGFDVLGLLHTDPIRKSIPVIVLSNLTDESYQKEALDLGAFKYVVKSSLDASAIVALVQEALAAHTTS